VDGDGFPDLLVGAPFVNQAYVYTDVTNVGSFGFALASDAEASIEGDPLTQYVSFWHFGAVGDWNDDGAADLALPQTDEMGTGPSVWHLVSGPFAGHLFAEDDYASVGEGGNAAVSLGYEGLTRDFDGDGIDDLIVSSHTTNEVYLYLGPLTQDLDPSQADLVLFGPAGSNTGSGLAAGDFDGDGVEDLAVAAYQLGEVYVVFGPLAAGAAIDLASSADFKVSGGVGSGVGVVEAQLEAQDFDGDGLDDLAIPARWSGVGGQIGVVFGSSMDGTFGTSLRLAESDMLFEGAVGDLFGYTVHWFDIDADGSNDFVAAASGTSRIAVWYGTTLFP
jgi:hypothetical protein